MKTQQEMLLYRLDPELGTLCPQLLCSKELPPSVEISPPWQNTNCDDNSSPSREQSVLATYVGAIHNGHGGRQGYIDCGGHYDSTGAQGNHGGGGNDRIC